MIAGDDVTASRLELELTEHASDLFALAVRIKRSNLFRHYRSGWNWAS